MDEWKHADRSNTEIYCIKSTENGVVLESVQPATSDDIGAVKQVVSAKDYCGHRVRFQAEVSTKDADGAGLWLTASHQDWHITDGMYDRLISGTSEWKPIGLVLDVPADTTYISYGLWMKGTGTCRLRCPRFDIVEQSVPVTAKTVWDRVSSQKWVERQSSQS